MTRAAASRPGWRELAGLGAVMLVGFLPRAWRLGRPGLTSDEAFSWRLARYGLGEMLRRAAEDVHPPLYYVLLKPWLAMWGDAPEALRGLSLVLGLLVVPLAFVLVREAARLDEPELARRVRAGALLAALLAALHATQVLQSRNARMYALGTALALASSWLLLRAQRRGGWAWWAAWGLAAAVAVATHYYLAFTVAAQAAWLALARRQAPPPWRGMLGAATVALASFAPWLPILWRQVRRVREEYWIPPATMASLVQDVGRWAVGADLAPWVAAAAALAVVASLAVAGWTSRAGRFLALQATAPWILGLTVSVATGRPLVLERCMVFAQAFLLCAWGVTMARLPRATLRAAAAAVLVLAVAGGLLATVEAYPAAPPAMATVARFLKRQGAEGDLAVVESPRALNKLRYYARQAQAAGLDIRCTLPERVPLAPHLSHVVSLAEGDAIAREAVFASGADTVWIGRESTGPAEPAPAGWTITYARIFEGAEGTRFALFRYQRSQATVPPARAPAAR